MNTVPKYVDYKNTSYLRQFLNPHGRINGKRKTDAASKHQRAVQNAVKRARFMALLSYVIK